MPELTRISICSYLLIRIPLEQRCFVEKDFEDADDFIYRTIFNEVREVSDQ